MARRSRSASAAFVAVCLTIALSLPATQAAGRSLQQDALSNSDGCLATIPKCEAGTCVARNIRGVARWACLRCQGSYETVVTNDGQDHVIQCVCPKGTYEDSGSGSCVRCPVNAYCPGGEKIDSPTANRGQSIACGLNQITRNTGARSQVDCVAPAGYALTNTSASDACPRGFYAPPNNRLGRCLRCQSGLDEPTTSGLVDGQRSSKRAVCKIPPGRFMSQGLVRTCPQGFFRDFWADFDWTNGTLCTPCNAGITTDGAGMPSAANCSRVMPGFGIANASLPAPALPTPVGGLTTAFACELGTYSSGGYCVPCPRGTVTLSKGAKSLEECMVPPGYYLPAPITNNMTTCPSGAYREGWLLATDPRAVTCTSCGVGIASEPRDVSENPLAPAGTLVRALPSSCYIEPGQGMIPQGNNVFTARDCPENTYGVAARVYGLTSAPCKPCPRNMVTDGLTKQSSMDACINGDGFGYSSEGASRCAVGFWSTKGSRKPCQQCPPGRTTGATPSLQNELTDCVVRPGFGIVNATANSFDLFDPPATGQPDSALIAYSVLECPLGYYSAGGAVGTECTKCDAGTTTENVGSIAQANCTVCAAGYGKPTQGAAGSCSICTYGTFSTGGSSTAACTTCPSINYNSPVASVNGTDMLYTSAGTTLYQGAAGEEQCVARQSQMSPEAGQAFFVPSNTYGNLVTVTTNVGTQAACFALCTTPGRICFTQYEAASGICRAIANLDPSASDNAAQAQVVYKLPPSTVGSASKLKKQFKAKELESGFYAYAAITNSGTNLLNNWITVGSTLDATARTFATGTPLANALTGTSRSECRQRCDVSNVCWGFIWNPANSGCYFRGGVDQLGARSFVQIPSAAEAGPINLAQFKW